MKYTNKNDMANIAIQIGTNIDALKKIDKLLGTNYYYLYEGTGYGERQCIYPYMHQHSDLGYFKSQGYTIISVEEFFSQNCEYEIY